MIEWSLPLEVVSPNRKEHWSKTHKRNQRNLQWLQACWIKTEPKPQFPLVVRFDRHHRSNYRRFDDDDNLRTAYKFIKDKVADFILPGLRPGKADGDPRFTFHYIQTLDKSIAPLNSTTHIIIATPDEYEGYIQTESLRELGYIT